MNKHNYPFDLIKDEYFDNKPRLNDFSWIKNRPIIRFTDSMEKGAKHFIPGEKLLTAINTSIAIGDPLLVTGEPGTGKTQIAYYIAYKLSLEKVLHFQVKSTSKAQDLLYVFDTIKYFQDANIHDPGIRINKGDYIEKGPFWNALISDKPRVLLIDEIDKAPRDFPNDLLFELDQNKFKVPELGEDFQVPDPILEHSVCRPIVVITSNSERRLPEPFLRRCVFHYITFNELLLEKAVNARKNEYPDLSPEFLKHAIARFIDLRKQNLRKKPGTSELLTWLRVMSVASNVEIKTLEEELSHLPYLGTLLKDHADLEEIEKN